MSTRSDDRLLAMLRAVIWVLMILIMIAGAVFVGLTLALPFMGAGGLEDMKIGSDPTVRWTVVAMLVLAIGVLVLAINFFRTLLAVIDTVGEGDPFVPENADRLEKMAWITVYGFGFGIVLTAMAMFVKARAPEAELTVDLDPGLLILTLVLFVLSRVFRHGTEMRHDLEGTV